MAYRRHTLRTSWSLSLIHISPAISGGVYVDELGGGICQVSSTLFNAVARADLEITSWVNHSWPSSYVPIGCDATISTGGPDFKFRNNTERCV